MSTSLSTTRNQARKRVGFKANTDGLSDDEGRVLDEQEQDEVIDGIRHKMEKSDREHQLGTGIMALLSFILHVIYLFNPLRPPTAVLFATPDMNSPIPLNIMFTCLHLCLQGYLCISVFYPPANRKARDYFFSMWSNTRVSTGYTPSIHPYLFPLLMSSIAPVLCILLRKGWVNFTWWCFCGTLFSIHSFVRRGRLRDEARIEGLEKLKYHAKGA